MLRNREESAVAFPSSRQMNRENALGARAERSSFAATGHSVGTRQGRWIHLQHYAVPGPFAIIPAAPWLRIGPRSVARYARGLAPPSSRRAGASPQLKLAWIACGRLVSPPIDISSVTGFATLVQSTPETPSFS